MCVATIYSRSCFNSSFLLFFITLCLITLYDCKPKLCPDKSLFHTRAVIPGWDGATGSDLSFGASLWSARCWLLFEVDAGQQPTEQKWVREKLFSGLEVFLWFVSNFPVIWAVLCSLLWHRKLEEYFLHLFPVAHDALVIVRRETSDAC